jgi:hypothetical protein
LDAAEEVGACAVLAKDTCVQTGSWPILAFISQVLSQGSDSSHSENSSKCQSAHANAFLIVHVDDLPGSAI